MLEPILVYTTPGVYDTAGGAERPAFLYFNDEEIPAVNGEFPGGDARCGDDGLESARNHLECGRYIGAGDCCRRHRHR